MLGKYAKVVFLISLVLAITTTVVGLWGAPFIVNRQIQKSVQLTPDSMMYEKWRKLPVPMDFKIYVFNVTNREEVNQGANPKLQEIGPYVYKQYRERTVLGLGPNDTIKYMLKKTFVFDPQASGALSPDDEVTVINFSYMAAILSVYELMPSFVNMVNGALQQFFGGNLIDPFLRVKVRDLFFDGIFLNCSGDHSALGLVCGKIRTESPPNMRPAEDGENGFYFSMFSHMNLTETGPFEMVRGTENVQELGHIFSYRNATRMNHWGDKYCGMINGSDSTIFPPMDEANIPERLYSFEPEICRSLYISLVEKRELFELPAYYYEMPESALAAKSANHDNKCFCRHDWSGNHDGCLLMGLLNLNPCQGAPAIASLPHFYLGSEELLEYFAEGVQPDREKHASYAYLDPVTGVALSGAKRMQFNIELRQMPNTPQLAKVPTGLFPLLWIEEGAEIPADVQEELRNAHQKLAVVRLLPWIFMGISLVCMLASAVFLVRAGALPCFPRASNSVSFIMRPATNKVH